MKLYLLWAAVFVATAAVAKGPAKEKEKKDKKAETYVFQDVKTVPVTSVKDQSRSGTCWSFSGMGEVESDLLVRGKGEHDLAEMGLSATHISKKPYAMSACTAAPIWAAEAR